MVRKLKKFPERRGQPEKYNWTEWLDGEVRSIKRGVDFECDGRSMASAIRQAAKRAGQSVRVSVDGDTVVFQRRGK